MTALVGYCFKDGAFLVADTQRILNDPKTNKYWANFQVSKIFKLNENIGLATCGNPIDEARLALQVKTKPESTKDEITKMADIIFKNILLQDANAQTNLVIFGHENGEGFIRHLEWDAIKKQFIINDYTSNKVFVDGVIPENFYELAAARLKDSYAPSIKGTQLDLWAEMIINDIVKTTEQEASLYGSNPVSFPIDSLIFRVGYSPQYIRRLYARSNIKEHVEHKLISDLFTVQI